MAGLFSTITPPDASTVLATKALPVVLLALLWCWEAWRPFFGQREGRLLHAARNLAIGLVNTVVLGLVFGSLTVMAAAWSARHESGLLTALGLFGPARFVLALVLLDAWMYIWHRANHVIPLLWRFHRMHHSDRHMDVTTATRFHLGEHVISATLRLGLIPLVGIDVWNLVVYDALVIAVTQLHHADVSLGRWDHWLRLVIVTPDMHKVHHSDVPAETHANFSTVLSWWDHIAGTLRMRADAKTIVFGVRELNAPVWNTWRGMWLTPFVAPSPANEPVPGVTQAQATISRIASTSTAAPVGSAANPRALRA